MTRKDYILLAEPLRKAYKIAGDRPMPYASDVLQNVEAVIMLIAEALHKDNPRFDTQHFVEVITGQRGVTSRPSRKVFKI